MSPESLELEKKSGIAKCEASRETTDSDFDYVAQEEANWTFCSDLVSLPASSGIRAEVLNVIVGE